ncbi:MAG: L-threonylcarbamoyladenylate synthase [Spirochaetaceae bacterium]|jgi:tRNA threonylcarbamoyl adenosine modification protein (Sua5/YciO/YrdC/YwlC family)|nr:L-threonylcarbamoyladenylate synthase [Spirochaetaceae bacterium]
MIHEYVVSGNIDNRIMERAAAILKTGGIVALPTDTSWIIACSFASSAGIKKLRRLSGTRNERFFTLLCTNISHAGEFCSLDNTRFRFIKRLIPGPFVFILKTLLGAERALGLKRSELGIRIPNHPIPHALIRTLGQPLYSITAKRTLGNDGDYETDAEALFIPEEDLFEGGWELEVLQGVDCILDPGEDLERLFSTILDLSGDEVLLVRQGAGDSLT